jgi:hypothetical protein
MNAKQAKRLHEAEMLLELLTRSPAVESPAPAPVGYFT